MNNKIATLVCALLFLAVPLFAPIYMKFEGIQGEAKDPAHAGWIELESFSWGATQAGAMSHGGGGGEGKVGFHDITFTHTIDKASPVLMQAAAIGKHFQTVKLDTPAVKYVLSDVYIRGVQPSHSGGQAAARETVSLQFLHDNINYPAPPTANPAGRVGAVPGTNLVNPVQGNATLNGSAVTLSSIRLVGQTQAIIVVCDVGGGQAAASLGRSRGAIPTLTIRADSKQPGGPPVTFTFTNVLVSSYSAAAGGCSQATLNFATGPSTGY